MGEIDDILKHDTVRSIIDEVSEKGWEISDLVIIYRTKDTVGWRTSGTVSQSLGMIDMAHHDLITGDFADD